MSARFGFRLPLWFGFAVLYLPLAWLLLQSFNDSGLVGLWGGLSLRWYGALFEDRTLLGAAGLSLWLGALVASLALVVGTLAAYALERGGPFRARGLFRALLLVPLVLPPVVTGLALLFLLVGSGNSLGWPATRGSLTIALAQAVYATAFVALIVAARLSRLDPRVEEAAADLGARPAVVFRRILLPQLAPALVAGWLVAFLLSFDDLVLASFAGGPGSTTLPIELFSRLRLGLSPQANALAALLLIAAAGLATLLVRLLFQRQPRPAAPAVGAGPA